MESLSISLRPVEVAAAEAAADSPTSLQPERAAVGASSDAPRAARRQMGRTLQPLQVGTEKQAPSQQDQASRQPRAKAGRACGPPSKLHEWLAREIEGKLSSVKGGSNVARPSSATGARAAAAGKVSSSLDELIEGRRGGWREQKTVIVDIRNGRRREATSDQNEPSKREEHEEEPKRESSADFGAPEAQDSTLAVRQVAKIGGRSSKNSSANETRSGGARPEEHSGDQQQIRPKTEELFSFEEDERLQKRASSAREQVLISSAPNATPKGKTPPTFGEAPYKLTQLPYFSYYGKARNVDLVSSADRRRSATSGRGTSEHSIASDGQHSELGAASNSSGSSAGSITRIPTLSRTYKHQSRQASGDEGSQEDQLSTASTINRRIDEQQRRLPNKNGYSNISNLFAGGQPVSKGQAHDQRQQQQRRQLNSKLGSPASDWARRTRGQSSSLLNLNQHSGPTEAKAPQRLQQTGPAAAVGPSNLRRRNSLTQQLSLNGGNTLERIRSRNTLGSSTNKGNSSRRDINTHTTTTATTMRRQNGGTAHKQLPPSQQQQQQPQQQQRSPSYRSLRPASAAGGFVGGRNYRSPSASSLYYGGSAGLSPYGAPIDPDCPVHGYSPSGQPLMSKSSQHLALGASPDAGDLFYDPYPYPAANYYERPYGQQQVLAPAYARPDAYGAGLGPGASFGRYSNGGAPPGQQQQRAYYNASSRFSLRQPPSASGQVRSALAPTNEQLRRILGHQPHTKPIHLHPQWAYSRPFIHLQGPATRSPSPLDNIDQEGAPHPFDIRPRFEPFNQLQDTQAIRAVNFHPSGEVYAIGSNSRALRICAYPADHELRHFGPDHVAGPPRILFKFLQVHRGSIYCVSFNGSGQLLATGSNDQTVHIVRYNSVTHSPDGDEYRLTMHDGTVRGLCFIDDTTNGSSLLLSAGGGDNKIYVTDCDTITPFQSMAGHTQMVMALHHWGGASFVSASYDRTIRFWDLRTRACTSIISAPPATSQHGGSASGKWAGPGAPVCSVKIDPTGRLLASGHSDSTCMLYDIRGARIIQAFKPHDDEIRTVSFSPKSYYLLTGGYDGRIVLTDLQGDLTQELPSVCVAESDDKIVQSDWHPSDFTFVTTSANKTATLWAIPTD